MNPPPDSTTPTESRRRALVRLLRGAVGSLGLSGLQAAASGSVTLFFYSPETNVNNFSVLKGEFDTFLASHGGHRFQPFSHRETFESRLAEGAEGLFLLSSWHYTQLATRHKLIPLLVGRARGGAIQRHLLFGQDPDPASLRGQRIATAGTRDFARTLLREMLPGQDDLVDSFDLLVVPKDIDALMAVGFGAAKAAIATEGGAEKLSRINPKQSQSLRPVGKARESLLPVVAVSPGVQASVQDLVRVLSGMDSEAPGRSRLQLLGIEAFRELDAVQKERLRP